MDILNIVEFKDWFWEKFEEWRAGKVAGPTAFARYLGIEQQYVSAWLNGKYKPGLKFLPKLAEHYPDIYEVLNIDQPYVNHETPDERAQRILDEIKATSPEERTKLLALIEQYMKTIGASRIE